MRTLRILIVEDEFIIATNLKQMLEGLGYETYEPVSSKTEAIAALEKLEVDLVLLDINLHGKHEGIEIGDYITRFVHVPFIYLTSNSDKATIDAAKQTHPNSYIIKPFTEEDIYSAIEMAVASLQKNNSDPNQEAITILADSFFIKLGNKFCRVEIKDITYFEAEGKMMNIHTIQDQKFYIRTSLESLFAQLKPFGFVRVHRSFCINTKHLNIINHEFIMVANNQVPLGRNYREDLLGNIKTLN